MSSTRPLKIWALPSCRFNPQFARVYLKFQEEHSSKIQMFLLKTRFAFSGMGHFVDFFPLLFFQWLPFQLFGGWHRPLCTWKADGVGICELGAIVANHFVGGQQYIEALKEKGGQVEIWRNVPTIHNGTGICKNCHSVHMHFWALKKLQVFFMDIKWCDHPRALTWRLEVHRFTAWTDLYYTSHEPPKPTCLDVFYGK